MRRESAADHNIFCVRTNTPISENYGNIKLVSGSDEDGKLHCEINIDNHIEGRQPGPGAPLFLYELDRWTMRKSDSLVTSQY